MEASHGFRKANEGFELTNGGTIRGLPLGVVILTHFLVLNLEDLSRLSGEHRLLSLANFNVGLKLLFCEVLFHLVSAEAVHVDDMASDLVILLVVFFVKDNEEKVKARHDRRRNVDVLSKGFVAIVAAMHRVGCSKNASASIKSGMDASLSNWNCLLLHGLVDSCLIFDVHLVELVDTTDSVVSQHQGTSFDTVLTSLNILANRSCQTSSTRWFSTCIDCSRQELTDIFKELRLGSGGVADHTNVDVTSKLDTIGSFLSNTTKKL
jgi:hypothetical protein